MSNAKSGTGDDLNKCFDGMTLEEFDAASSHPYECRCELCKRWWKEVPEEE